MGCVAPTSWQARNACDALAATATWSSPSQQPSSDQLFDHLKRTGRESSGGRNRAKSWGDVRKAFDDAANKISTQYTIAYVQHAPMEPRAAVAEWVDGKLTVWTGTQQPSRVHGQLREAFRLSSEQVRVIVPDTGGGFGGKHTGEAAIEAARLAKSAGKPVHLRWTREEEFTWAYFRPAGLIEVNASIDSSGKLTGWEFFQLQFRRLGDRYTLHHSERKNAFSGRDAALRAMTSTNRQFDRLDSLLVESVSQFTEPTGRAVARVTLTTGTVVEGTVLWMNASHIKLRAPDGSEVIVAKEMAEQIVPLAGTESAPPGDFTPDRWAGQNLDVG